MLKKFCDRCGKVIPSTVPTSQTVFPIYSIKETILPGNTFDIDLCASCIKSFEKWIKKEAHDA